MPHLIRVVLAGAFLALAATPASAIGDRHALFTELLQDHLAHGFVKDYGALQEDPRLEHYIAQLASTDPTSLDGNDRIAFWLNVYNAHTLKLIADNERVDSINELHLFGSLYLGVVFGRTIWRTWEFPIHDQRYTLDDVEHEILRPVYQDFRHHGAINCASVGCPPLRHEAYEGPRLDAQLDDQMQAWLRDPRYSRYDATSRTLYVSKILDWYREDFVKDPGAPESAIIDVILPYLAPDVQTDLRANRGNVELEYLSYDWGLNEVK